MGTIVGLTLSGFIVDSLGWEAMFYIEGPMALIFLLMWMTLVYDSPEQHPRISDKEKAYIVSAMGKSASKDVSITSRVPWRIFHGIIYAKQDVSEY